MHKMKRLAKSYLPISLQRYISSVMIWSKNVGSFRRDRRRFLRYYAKYNGRTTEQGLRAKLIFYAHSLEKGLSHTKLRYGFGARAHKALATAMQEFNNRNYDKTDESYQNALSVIRQYISVHSGYDREMDRALAPYDSNILDEAKVTRSELGGISIVNNSSKLNNRSKNFKELFSERSSVREYDDSPVDSVLLAEALSIATKSPSICNRQTVRVRILDDPESIQDILKAQGGLDGYPIPPVLLVITTDIRSYVGINERNQPYADGGMFAMSLLLALEYVGLAACSLNAMLNNRQERLARKLLDVDSESFIMFISVGNFKDSVKVPKSFRYSSEYIARQP